MGPAHRAARPAHHGGQHYVGRRGPGTARGGSSGVTATVLVIGGTGRLGAPVARQLRHDGYRVRLLVRARGCP
ncbi:MAG TPA: NmrA family NAD(P)-binding protein [Streptosporangiaceae bacterium]|nr:NmrA family NAD(P)-binding protein [Streptosporangiaceae bacterium]